MKYRPHRGSLADSMAEVVELDGTLATLSNHLSEQGWIGKIEVKKYIFDERINWNTHIVTVNGNAVGFTDGPVQ